MTACGSSCQWLAWSAQHPQADAVGAGGRVAVREPRQDAQQAPRILRTTLGPIRLKGEGRGVVDVKIRVSGWDRLWSGWMCTA